MTSNDYHMIRYIHEIPAALAKTLGENEAPVRAIHERALQNGIHRIVLTGVGSSFTAVMMAAPLFRRFCSLPAYFLPSTEAGPFMDSLVDEHTLFVSVSRSGERGWVVDALMEAMRRGAMGLALTGTPDSLLAQGAQHVLVTGEGPEITFAKTKSVAACAVLLGRLALEFAAPGDPQVKEQLNRLRSLPALVRYTLKSVEPQVKDLVPRLAAYSMVMAAGTIGNYGTALEFAIKLPEAAGIPVIANDTGNMLHGPWGPIDASWLSILMVTAYDLGLSQTTLDLAGRLHSHRLVIIEPRLDIGGRYEYSITLPAPVDPLTAGLVYLVPMQLLTYYWSVSRGQNPDAPAAMRIMLDAMLPPGREEPEMRAASNS